MESDEAEVIIKKTIAIVGASVDRAKYGNKAVRAFIQQGWTVYPVNPKLSEVEGLRCYASIDDVPAPVDRISMYVPPNVGRRMLGAIAAKSPRELFLNPGSGDPDLVREAEALGLRPIEACSIVDIGLKPDMFHDK
ncbi:MAG: CoA-binding protein [Deltaproteobacteria bacterium]|nr:CoA-binding protein [Deltaproteobacteria bacterium]